MTDRVVNLRRRLDDHWLLYTPLTLVEPSGMGSVGEPPSG